MDVELLVGRYRTIRIVVTVAKLAEARSRLRSDLTRVPRNWFKGGLHKMDLRVSEELRFAASGPQGSLRYSTCSTRRIYGNYNGLVDTSNYCQPVQNGANAYLPRSGQFAFKLTF
jgi:hypothetical protein